MEHLINSVKHSINSGNWYGAIATALSIPDICSKITYGDKTNGKRYAEWFDKFMGSHYKTNWTTYQLDLVKQHHPSSFEKMAKGTNFSGNDCYALRCAFLHEGSGEIKNQRAQEILNGIKFYQPNNSIIVHGTVINDKLVLDIFIFCTQLIEGVKIWQESLSPEQIERLNIFLKVKDVFQVLKEN